MGKLHYKESPTPAQKTSFRNYLSEDEELILVTGLSKAYIRSKFVLYLLFPGLIGLLGGYGLGRYLGWEPAVTITVALFLMIILATLKTLHLFHANRYLLTTSRVVVKKGLFAVKLTAAIYDKVTHLEVDQGLVDRLLLHHGTIIIHTAGMNREGIILKYVDYPMELKNLMERLINREREQYGKGGSVGAVEGEIIG